MNSLGDPTTDQLFSLLSLYQGRPITVRHTEVSIPKPSHETCGPGYEMLLAWTEMCIILSVLAGFINGPPHLLKHPTTNYQLSRVGERLLQWVKDLPEKLQWKPNSDLPAPGVCALHMQFFAAMILLHRPFAGYRRSSHKTEMASERRLTGYTPTISRQICLENAIRLSKLLAAYRQEYGVEKVFTSMLHMIFVGASTLIAHISTAGGNRTTADRDGEWKWLQVCLQALDDLTPSFLIAGRVRRMLSNILECCGLPELARTRGENDPIVDVSMHQPRQHLVDWHRAQPAMHGPTQKKAPPQGQQRGRSWHGQKPSLQQPPAQQHQEVGPDRPPIDTLPFGPNAFIAANPDPGLLNVEDFELPDMPEDFFGEYGGLFRA